jgi:hypothetical protein
MKKLLLGSLAALALLPATASARPMTATDLATMKRIAAPAVSPDGRWLVYQLRETDLAANRGRTDLWLLDLSRPGAQAVKVASTPQYNEHDPRFLRDGRWLYFLSGASGSEQVWRVSLPSGRPERVTDVKDGISGYLPAPERRPHRDLGRPQHSLPRPCLRRTFRRRRKGRAAPASMPTRVRAALGCMGDAEHLFAHLRPAAGERQGAGQWRRGCAEPARPCPDAAVRRGGGTGLERGRAHLVLHAAGGGP